MILRRVYNPSEATQAFNHAIEIANSLPNFASEDELEKVLAQIPDSDLYYKYVTSGDYGYEILILYPVKFVNTHKKEVYEAVDFFIYATKKDVAFEEVLDIFCGLFETQEECNLAKDYARKLGYNI